MRLRARQNAYSPRGRCELWYSFQGPKGHVIAVSSRQQHANRTVHGANIALHHPTMYHSITVLQAHAHSRGPWGVPPVSRLAWVVFEVPWRATNHKPQRELVRVWVVRLREASHTTFTAQPYWKAFATKMAAVPRRLYQLVSSSMASGPWPSGLRLLGADLAFAQPNWSCTRRV